MIEQGKGSVLAGRYRLDALLGEGGVGAVWLATHLLTHKRVAVKLLRGEVVSPETALRFVREARAASAVRHPNVVEIHDILTLDDGSPALIMDYLEGETLAQRLRRSGAIPLSELAAIMAPVLSAVGSAHAVGIVHRDLKPDNIFLARLGDGRIEPKVLDFGIAKLMPLGEKMDTDSAGLTRTGAVLGTPYYMAPEQAFGEKDLDARADVWTLGVILYECSCGRRPIDGESLGQVFKMITVGPTTPLAQLVPDLSSDFVALVERMMQRDREQRIRDLREPFEFLRRWADASVQRFGAPVSISRSGAPPGSLSPPANARVPATSSPVQASAAGLTGTGAPLTNGVAVTQQQSRLIPALMGGGVVAVLVVAVLWLIGAMNPEPAPITALAGAGAAASGGLARSAAAIELVHSATPLLLSASAVQPAPPLSASVSTPRARTSPAAAARPATTASGQRPLPGGVHSDIPF